jgi:hypothetical protein
LRCVHQEGGWVAVGWGRLWRLFDCFWFVVVVRRVWSLLMLTYIIRHSYE